MTASSVSAPGSAVLASDALVVFGFTGDLANKKIIPALYAMAKKKPVDAVLDQARRHLGALGPPDQWGKCWCRSSSRSPARQP